MPFNPEISLCLRPRWLSGAGALALFVLLGTGCGGRVENAVAPPSANVLPPPLPEVECDATPCVRQLAAGNGHSCALIDDGSVRCWGRNHFGQTGVDTVEFSARPANVRLPVRAERIAVGAVTSGALARGKAYCWGDNGDANLGPGIWDGQIPYPVPTELPLHELVDLGFGQGFFCTLGSRGEVSCIGNNVWGNVGLGAAAPDVPTLAALPGLAAQSLSVGLTGTCVALTTSGVSCWGDNKWQALGPAAGSRAIPSPRRVPELEGLQQAVLAGTFGCALSASSRVACWGTSLLGETGNATNGPYWPPVEVAGSEGIARLAAGNGVCGVTQTGAVECWGSNVGGQLGSGRADSELSDTAHPVPILVGGISDAVDVAVGLDFACALTHRGHVMCWGSNQFGQLGLGVTDDSPHVPTEVEW